MLGLTRSRKALVDRIGVGRRSLEKLAFDQRLDEPVGELHVIGGIRCGSRGADGGSVSYI